MKTFLAWFLCVCSGFTAFAHIGSPNVFFEGPAGPYSIYAVIRPPGALPGAADVTVQVRDEEVLSISLKSVQWQAGPEGSPPPVSCESIVGGSNLWSGQVWFLRPGSYTVELFVEGAKGRGQAIVPVNVLGVAGRQMARGVQGALIVLGIALFLGAVAIVRAVSRDAFLRVGEKPLSMPLTWRVTAVAVLVLAGGVAVGALRWREMARVYRTQGVQKPEPVTATVLAEPERLLLELQPAEQSLGTASWSQLVPDHGKLMHLFLLREPGLNVFAHLHPLRQDGQTFMLELPPLATGAYQLYGELTFENGLNQTVISKVTLPTPLGQPMLPPLASTNAAGDIICGTATVLTNEPGKISRDMDDSWHVEQARAMGAASAQSEVARHKGSVFARLMGGYSLVFENAEAVETGRDKELRFTAFAADGREVALQPYMGMPGHAVVRREDGSVFAHLHPSGSFSMASQQIFKERLSDPNRAATVRERRSPPTVDDPRPGSSLVESNRVNFPYEFPADGNYRLWIQVRIGGRVLTGVYDLKYSKRAVL